MVDFIDRLRELAAQIPKQVEHIRTEEATKSALVMPFITNLGYNVHDPAEVTPEFVADVGTKKGEKVDYVILKDGRPIIMFECKAVSVNLDKIEPTQLFRYFSATRPVRFGILTNGIVYRIFSDLQEPNVMDKTPFLELNMLGLEEPAVEELKKFSKGLYDEHSIVLSASDFKYTREIKQILTAQLQEPTDDFVKYFAGQIYPGRWAPSVKDQFSKCVKRAFGQFVNDQINMRLKSALVPEGAEQPANMPANSGSDVANPPMPDGSKPDREIVTTPEELEAYYIIKAIVRETVEAKRVVLKDALSYCAILLDNNNRRPICRLYFNNPAHKSIGFFDEQKQETRVPIEAIDDIYSHSTKLKAAIAPYLSQPIENE